MGLEVSGGVSRTAIVKRGSKMGTKLPWHERVPMLSINPDAATREDVERLASERMNVWCAVIKVVKEKTNCTTVRAHEIAAAVIDEIEKVTE